MKYSKVAISIALAQMLAAAAAFAADRSPWQSAAVQPTAYDYGDYYAQAEGASPSDKEAQAPAPSEGGCQCEQKACDSCGCGCGLEFLRPRANQHAPDH